VNVVHVLTQHMAAATQAAANWVRPNVLIFVDNPFWPPV